MMPSNFELETIVDSSTGACALAFVTDSYDHADDFFTRVVDIMYAPRGRGSSYLRVTTTEPVSVTFDAYSDDLSASIELSGGGANIPTAVLSSLSSIGAVLILFGWRSKNGFGVLKPSDNHLVRRQVVVDGVATNGGKLDLDLIANFLAMLDEESAAWPA